MKKLVVGALGVTIGAFRLAPVPVPAYEQVRVICSSTETPDCEIECLHLCREVRDLTGLRSCLKRYEAVGCNPSELRYASMKSHPLAVCANGTDIAAELEISGETERHLQSGLRTYLTVVTEPDGWDLPSGLETQLVEVVIAPRSKLAWNNGCHLVHPRKDSPEVLKVATAQMRVSPWLLAVEVPEDLRKWHSIVVVWKQAEPKRVVYNGIDVGVGSLEVLGF